MFRPSLLRFRALTAALAVGAVGTLVIVDAPHASGEPAVTVAAGLAPVASGTASGHWHRWPGHRNRRILLYRVRGGDTASGLAVRFHAWTAELRAVNHLGSHGGLRSGQRIRIPVVLSAWRRDHPHRRAGASRPHRASRPRAHPWRNADLSRAAVRRVVTRTAKRHGLHPDLPLAISWQESGWQQRRVSSAGAIGAMQVMPSTGRWVSTYAGRRLNLYGLHDNVTAGVLVVKVLKQLTSGRRVIGAYYQGLGSIREHRMYPSTKKYVANVRYLRRMLRQGRTPQ